MLWKASHGLIAVASRQPASRRTLSTLRRGSTSFSIAIGSSVSKQRVVEKAREAASPAPRGLSKALDDANGPDAAVILTSRSLAPWLADQDFLSALLHVPGQPPPEINVLSAVVDGIPWPDAPHSLRDGISVLHGGLASMLPDLWGSAQVDCPSVQPSITVPFPPLRNDSGPLEATIPLANTVFNNGRPFTMFASRWQSQPGSPLKLTQKVEKRRQLIVPDLTGTNTTSNRSSRSDISAPLLPITRPRRIVAGLGNIIRQVEIDGKPAPASGELEAVIPALLDARSESAPTTTSTVGPVGVWALVVPEGVAAATGGEMPRLLRGSAASDYGGGGGLSEWGAAVESSVVMARLLASGARLQRILSGGGGWGLKQGLLSLDPQVRYSVPDEEDVERFIRSFKGETSPDDVITPGSYIQFFVEPIHPSQKVSAINRPEQAGLDFPEVVVGTCDTAEEGEHSVEDGVQVVTDYFGALSSQGMFIASPTDTVGSHGMGLSTKIDAPNCRVEVHGKPRHERDDSSA